MWEESLGTQAGAHLIEGVRLIRGPLNTGFTVFESLLCDKGLYWGKTILPSTLIVYIHFNTGLKLVISCR